MLYPGFGHILTNGKEEGNHLEGGGGEEGGGSIDESIGGGASSSKYKKYLVSDEKLNSGARVIYDVIDWIGERATADEMSM